MKTYKITSILPILLLLFINAKAQDWTFGLNAGTTFSNYKTKDSNPKKSVLGMQAGLFVEVKPSSKIGVQLQMKYIEMGAKYTADEEMEGSRYKNSYFQIPLLLRYNIWQRLQVEAGPYISQTLRSKFKRLAATERDYDTDEDQEFNKYVATTDIGASDYGLIVGTGYQIKPKLALNLQYNMGFAKIDRKEERHPLSPKNRSLGLTLSYALK